MGRLRTTIARRVGANRREFFRRAGGAAFALGAASLLPACGGGDDDDEPAPPTPGSGNFQHGVASGDPLADRVILWTRVTPRRPARLRSTAWSPPTRRSANVVARASATTDAARDYTVKVDAAGAAAGHHLLLPLLGARDHSPVGRTRTLPVGSDRALRIAVVSCSSLAHGYFNAYRRIAERADLDLCCTGRLHLRIGSGEFGNLRAYEPPARHHAGRLPHPPRPVQARADSAGSAPPASDGRDLGRPRGGQQLVRRRRAEPQRSAEGAWPGRVAAALQAYYEWMPVRVVDPANLRKANRSFAFGDLVDLLMLEQRLVARSAQLQTNTDSTGIFTQTGAFADPSRQLLGTEQEDWLATRLRASTAKWKLIGQGVMFAQLKVGPESNADGGGRFINADQWDGYQPARDRLYAVLEGDASTPAVGNVVVLSGDAHSSWAADLSRDPNNDDVASGGYDPDTGAGSRAVEFVGTSVTSASIVDTSGLAESALRFINPHFKYIDLTRRGYLLLDADATRVVGEWWYVDTVESPSSVQSFGTAFQVQDGTNRLLPAAQTSPRVGPPALAP